MPWKPSDANRHNGLVAGRPHLQKQWADVANSVRARGGTDAEAIREANAAIGRTHDSNRQRERHMASAIPMMPADYQAGLMGSSGIGGGAGIENGIVGSATGGPNMSTHRMPTQPHMGGRLRGPIGRKR